jgi:hypothetical protein
MQKIADRKGVGAQLQDARNSWRNLKQTFYDPKSPLRKALDSKEPGQAVKHLIGKDRTAIEALAKYDPDLAARANTLRGYHEEAQAIRPSTAAPKPAPKLSPRQEPAAYPAARVATEQKIGAADVQAAKAEALDKRAQMITHRGSWVAAWPLFHVLTSVFRGELPNLGGVAVESAGTLGTVHAIANLMQRPAVVEFLTKATPKDVAAIPANLRGDFPRILTEAQKRGIKVSPALTRAFTGAAAAGIPAVQTGTDQGVSPSP